VLLHTLDRLSSKGARVISEISSKCASNSNDDKKHLIFVKCALYIVRIFIILIKYKILNNKKTYNSDIINIIEIME